MSIKIQMLLANDLWPLGIELLYFYKNVTKVLDKFKFFMMEVISLITKALVFPLVCHRWGMDFRLE